MQKRGKKRVINAGKQRREGVFWHQRSQNKPKLGVTEGASALVGLFPLTLSRCGFMLGATHELVQ